MVGIGRDAVDDGSRVRPGGRHLPQRLDPPPQAQAVEDRGHGHGHPQPPQATTRAQAPDQAVAS